MDPQRPSSPGEPSDARAGRCAIVGRPNVGKSTLLNALLGQKLVIASPAPGTTRSCVLGVLATSEPPTQIAFVDTPGVGHPKTALARMLAEQAKAGLADADAVLLVTDAGGRRVHGAVHPLDEPLIGLLKASGAPVVVALNKVDLVHDKQKLLPRIQAYAEALPGAEVVPTSAKTGDGVDALVGTLRQHMPAGKMYDDDFLTDRPERFFATELIREAALLQTRAEVPHGVAVWIDEWTDADGRTRIMATLVVEKPNHKKIVIGAKGSRIKAIGMHARGEIAELLGRPVDLRLWVKVVPGWTADPGKVRRMLEEGGA